MPLPSGVSNGLGVVSGALQVNGRYNGGAIMWKGWMPALSRLSLMSGMTLRHLGGLSSTISDTIFVLVMMMMMMMVMTM